MGKSRRAAVLPRLPRLAPVAAAVLALSAAPVQAGWDIVPAVQLRETYTDNVNLQPDEFAESQFITELTPSLSVMHKSRRLNLRSIFRVRAFAFSDHRVSGPNRSSNEFSLDGKATLIDDLLFVDATGSRAKRTISAFGQQYAGNDYADANRAPVTTYSISPYVVHRFGNTANLQARYTRDSVDASPTAQGTRTGLADSQGSTISASLNSGRAFRTVGWAIAYNDQRLDDSIATETRSQVLTTQLRYRVLPTLSLLANAGYDKYDYSALGGVTAGRSYSAGIDWNPSTRTRLEATLGHRFIGSTKMLRANHRSRRTVWSLTYNNEITNSRSNFLLPAAFDTASLLDGLFAATYPDPVARQRAVAEYMLLTGLPAQLIDSINYFSNRFILQKQARASVAFKAPRTTVMASLFSTQRDALSSAQSDSLLLGSRSASLNENTKQVGASLSLDYRISPRSALQLSQTNSHSESFGTGLKVSNSATRLMLSRTLTRKMNGSVELRRVSGSTGFDANGKYHENALAASLSLSL